MTAYAIEQLIVSQDALMHAIDARDIDAMNVATEAVRVATAKVALQDSWYSVGSNRARVEHAVRQSEALKIRVNTLSDWNRQRLDRLAELRGSSAAPVYNAMGKAR